MQTFRSRCARLGAAGAAALLTVAGLSVISVISAVPASAGTTPVPTAQNWSYPGPTGFGQLNETGAAASPTTARWTSPLPEWTKHMVASLVPGRDHYPYLRAERGTWEGCYRAA